MRSTVRRTMGAIAVRACVLGLGIGAHRLTARYRCCRERARRHAAWIAFGRGDVDRESDRVRELDAVEARLALLRPQPLDDLVAGSGDPGFTAWFLGGGRRGWLESGGEGPIAPRELIAHIEHFWGRAWRERAEAIRRGHADHARLEAAYRFASARPWVDVPPDPPPQALD